MRSILPHTQNPALREKARDLTLHEIASKEFTTLVRDMQKLLSKEKHGVALAAPQVGEAVRMFIVAESAVERREETEAQRKKGASLTGKDTKKIAEDLVYINPKVLKMSKDKSDKNEGCLSIRGLWGMVPRAEKITIQYLDMHGKKKIRGASGFLAHIFQHEIDHLEGTLYVDKAVELYEETSEEHHE